VTWQRDYANFLALTGPSYTHGQETASEAGSGGYTAPRCSPVLVQPSERVEGPHPCPYCDAPRYVPSARCKNCGAP